MEDNIIVLKFEDSKIPEFKEIKGKQYTYFGDDNDYPSYLIKLFNKSAKHNAIINNKVKYIFGEGFYSKVDNATTDKFIYKVNSANESLNDIANKCAIDIEIFGGFYLNIIPNRLGQIAEMYHLDFHRVRANEDCSQFFYKNDWTQQRDKPKEFPAFNPKKIDCATIFQYKEYRPGLRTYPLPNYVGAINYIESDVEVSKHTLTNAKTGFSATKLINFFNGEPAPEMQRDIQKRLEKKFTGSDGSKIIVSFNNDPAKAPTIVDLGSSDLTKEDFQRVDALITANLMAGHQITSPQLFGISEPGKLGARNELKMAFDIFNNTYASNKQRTLEKVFNFLAKFKGIQTELFLRSVDPVGIEFTDSSLIAAAPKSWLLEKMGVDTTKYHDTTLAGVSIVTAESDVKSQAQIISDSINSLSPLVANKVLESMTPDEIRSLAGLQPNPLVNATAGVVPETMEGENKVNSVLTNLTGRQHQQINRIVRQYTQGKLSKDQASHMLKSGFGFSDEDISMYLGLNDAKFSSEDINEIDVANMLIDGGENINEFHFIHSKECHFNSDNDMIDFEKKFFAKESFGISKNVSDLEANILKQIQKNANITSKDLAIANNIDVSYADEVIANLEKKGFIESTTTSTLGDVLVTRKLTKSLTSILGEISTKLPEIMVRYSYVVRPGIGAPIIPGTRPFCREMLAKPRLFSRVQIEKLSEQLGYSLWDRSGGFWNRGKGKGISASCRHTWKTNIVVKK
jgi:predicted transcriptional regulator